MTYSHGEELHRHGKGIMMLYKHYRECPDERYIMSTGTPTQNSNAELNIAEGIISGLSAPFVVFIGVGLSMAIPATYSSIIVWSLTMLAIVGLAFASPFLVGKLFSRESVRDLFQKD